jgi:hypothetical protein
MDAPKIKQIMKFTPSVPDITDFVPSLTWSKVLAKVVFGYWGGNFIYDKLFTKIIDPASLLLKN